MPTFDLDAAKEAGFTDQQIAEELARQYDFDLEGALAAGHNYEAVIPELMKKANPTWTQRWGQAMDEATDAFDSPEVDAEYETVKDWKQPAYYGPSQAVPQLDPVTGKAVGENLRMIGQGILSYPAALVDMAGEKLGFRKDDMPDVPLADQQYKSFNERLTMLDAKRNSLTRTNRMNEAQGYEGKDLTEIDAEIAELQTKLANIEANDPTIAERWIPSNPKWSEIRAKYAYTPESATGQAYAGVLGAAMTPAAEAEDWATDKMTQHIEDPLQREYAKDAASGVIEGASLVVGPKIASTGAKGVGAAARGTANVARGVRDRVRDFRYRRSPEGKIETEISNLQAKIDEVPAIVQEIRREFPNDPKTQQTLIDDVKKQADEMRVERAKLNVQFRRERARQLSDEYNSWMSGFRKRQPQGSGSRSLTGTALTWMSKHPKSVVAGAILDGLAMKATGGVSLIYSGGNSLRIIAQEGIKGFRDWYRAKGRIEADSDIKAPKLGEQDLDALIKQLPDEQQAVINDFMNGKAKPAEVIDIMDDWVNSKKSGDDWLAEQADIELETQRVMQEEQMFKQKALEDAELRADEAADLETRRIKQTPEEADLAIEEMKLRRDEADALKQREIDDVASGRGQAPKSGEIDIDEAIRMAELRATQRNSGVSEAAQRELESLRIRKERGETTVRRSPDSTQQQQTVTKTEQALYRRQAEAEGIDTNPAPVKPADAAATVAATRDLRNLASGRRSPVNKPKKTPNQQNAELLADKDVDLTPPENMAGTYSAPKTEKVPSAKDLKEKANPLDEGVGKNLFKNLLEDGKFKNRYMDGASGKEVGIRDIFKEVYGTKESWGKSKATEAMEMLRLESKFEGMTQAEAKAIVDLAKKL